MPTSVLLLLLSACTPGDAPLVTWTLSGAVADAADHTVMISEAATGASWLLPAEDFSAEIPAGDVSLALLDPDLRPVALFREDDATLFTLDADRDLGALTFDADAHTMTGPASRPSRRRGASDDLGDLVGITTEKDADGDNGVDVRAMADGGGDADGDGVPDVLDNDSNENGVYDTAEGGVSCAPRVESWVGDEDRVPAEVRDLLDEVRCGFFDNLKMSVYEAPGAGDGDSLPYTESHVLTALLAPPAGLAPYVDRVEVTTLPTWADATISMAAGGWSFASYPTTGDDWATHGYGLPAASDPMGNTVHTVWIDTDTDPAPAVFQLRMTLVDGSTIVYTARVFFVFATPPRLASLTDAAGTTSLSYPLVPGDTGSSSAPIALDGSGTYTLTASRPLDGAAGSEICGMDVSAEVFYEDSVGSQMNTMVVGTPLVPDTGACDPTVPLTVTLDAAALPSTWDGAPVSTYRIAMMVSSVAGDNAATNLWAAYATAAP